MQLAVFGEQQDLLEHRPQASGGGLITLHEDLRFGKKAYFMGH